MDIIGRTKIRWQAIRGVVTVARRIIVWIKVVFPAVVLSVVMLHITGVHTDVLLNFHGAATGSIPGGVTDPGY